MTHESAQLPAISNSASYAADEDLQPATNLDGMSGPSDLVEAAQPEGRYMSCDLQVLNKMLTTAARRFLDIPSEVRKLGAGTATRMYLS